MIIVTLSPAAGVIGPATFHPYASYEIRVQNTAALADNMAFQFTFSEPDAYGRQNFQLVKQTASGQPLATQYGVAPASAIQNQVLAFGATGTPLPVKGGGKVMAGLFDDPFFFDLNAFNQFVMLAKTGASLPARVAPFFPPNFPNNFFANFNVLAVVLELPTASLLSSKSNPKLGVWVRTVGQRRAGRPDGPAGDQHGDHPLGIRRNLQHRHAVHRLGPLHARDDRGHHAALRRQPVLRAARWPRRSCPTS